MIRELMERKRAAIEASETVLSSEVWWKEDSKSAGFAVVAKWRSRGEFQEWLKAVHPDGHKKRPADAPPIRKTINQFELVE